MIRAKKFEKMTALPVLVTLLAAGLSASTTSLAQEHHETEGESHGHTFHRNLFGGFIGFTGEDNRAGGGRERALTLGLEYERRFSESFGLGVGVERAFGDLDFTVITVPFVYHSGPWAFSAGPGIEIPDDDHDSEFVFRAAASYAFEFDRYELAPKAGLDFVNDELVFFAGVAIGFGF